MLSAYAFLLPLHLHLELPDEDHLERVACLCEGDRDVGVFHGEHTHEDLHCCLQAHQAAAPGRPLWLPREADRRVQGQDSSEAPGFPAPPFRSSRDPPGA